MKKLSIVLGLLLTTGQLFASTHIVKGKYRTNIENTKKNSIVKEKYKEESKININLLKETVSVLGYTEKAYIYLYKNKINMAKESIKKAISQLADVLNRPHPLYLLPINYKISTYKYVGSIKDVKKSIKLIKKLIDKDKLPQARELLNGLRDEIDIKTLNIPLVTFPSTLNLTLKYINENKISEAKDLLRMSLNTLVEIKNIIPIPVVEAEELINVASKKVHQNKKEAIKYLEEAKYQLRLAKILGYTSKSNITYKIINKFISH